MSKLIIEFIKASGSYTAGDKAGFAKEQAELYVKKGIAKLLTADDGKEAKEKAEQEAKVKAEQEAKAKAEQEAKAKAEKEAKAGQTAGKPAKN